MGFRWMSIIMANGMPDVAVRDDANVKRVLAERQAHYDELLRNRVGCSQEDIETGRVQRLVRCADFQLPVVDDPENSFTV